MAEKLRLMNPLLPLWIENESRKIGRIILPDQLYSQMVQSTLIDIQKPVEERIAYISKEYGNLPADDLIAAVLRLKKRLGGLRTQEAIADIQAGNHESWISNLLIYYDKTYEFDLSRHEAGKTLILELDGKTIDEQLELLLKIKNQIHAKYTYPAHRME